MYTHQYERTVNTETKSSVRQSDQQKANHDMLFKQVDPVVDGNHLSRPNFIISEEAMSAVVRSAVVLQKFTNC